MGGEGVSCFPSRAPQGQAVYKGREGRTAAPLPPGATRGLEAAAVHSHAGSGLCNSVTVTTRGGVASHPTEAPSNPLVWGQVAFLSTLVSKEKLAIKDNRAGSTRETVRGRDLGRGWGALLAPERP